MWFLYGVRCRFEWFKEKLSFVFYSEIRTKAENPDFPSTQTKPCRLILKIAPFSQIGSFRFDFSFQFSFAHPCRQPCSINLRENFQGN